MLTDDLSNILPPLSLSLSPLGGSYFEANLENEGSISGSESAFYRQAEGKVAEELTANGKLGE